MCGLELLVGGAHALEGSHSGHPLVFNPKTKVMICTCMSVSQPLEAPMPADGVWVWRGRTPPHSVPLEFGMGLFASPLEASTAFKHLDHGRVTVLRPIGATPF
jgi:hypothetical protein